MLRTAGRLGRDRVSVGYINCMTASHDSYWAEHLCRYFFNLGLSVYRSRKLPEGTPADSLPAPVACTQAAPTGTYIVPLTSSAGYQMVPPQGTVVYQQAPPASYPTTAGPTYASYSVLPQAASYTEISPSTITTAGPTSYAASVPAAAPVQAQMTAVK